jgi:hypothetical protein
MKTIKGLVTFLLLTAALGACFNPPEFSVVPSIRYENIVFKENPNPSLKDSLILTINFQDGNGDLGLGDKQTDEPYHLASYYLASGGDTIPIGTFSPRTDMQEMLNIPSGVTGTIVTKKFRDKNAEYQDMFPDYVCPFVNTAYEVDSIYVLERDKGIYDPAVVHRHRIIPGSADFPPIHVLRDTFALRPNPLHYNIRVDFLIKQNNDTFLPFNWKNSCGFGQDFSARFPILSDNDNPLEGTLRYGMGTVGFHALFDGKILKLRVRIWDRALNASNVIETPPFTLQDILE